MLEIAYSTRVYYDDTDAGGVVYYANYLKYCERAKQEFLLKHDCDLFKLHEDGLYLVVKQVKAEYVKSLRLGDRLDVFVGVKRIRRASIELLFEIISQGEVVFRGEIQSVMVDDDNRIIRLPNCINKIKGD